MQKLQDIDEDREMNGPFVHYNSKKPEARMEDSLSDNSEQLIFNQSLTNIQNISEIRKLNESDMNVDDSFDVGHLKKMKVTNNFVHEMH